MDSGSIARGVVAAEGVVKADENDEDNDGVSAARPLMEAMVFEARSESMHCSGVVDASCASEAQVVVLAVDVSVVTMAGGAWLLLSRIMAASLSFDEPDRVAPISLARRARRREMRSLDSLSTDGLERLELELELESERFERRLRSCLSTLCLRLRFGSLTSLDAEETSDERSLVA
jgi:hypothetical protein